MVKDYVCVDIETSGVRVKWDKIIEIGAVKVRDSKAVDTFSELINPGLKLSPYITELTGITDEMLKDKPFIEKVLPRFIEFTGDDVIMGHNIMFDYSFLKQNAINQKLKFDKMGIDTLKIARKTLKGLESRGLEYLCNYLKHPIVLEVERPVEEMAKRRISFYQRQGFTLWKKNYYQPPYKPGDDFLPMYLMVHGELDCEKDFETIKRRIHKEVYGVKDN